MLSHSLRILVQAGPGCPCIILQVLKSASQRLQAHKERTGPNIAFAMALAWLQEVYLVVKVAGIISKLIWRRPRNTIYRAKVRRSEGIEYLSYSLTCGACNDSFPATKTQILSSMEQSILKSQSNGASYCKTLINLGQDMQRTSSRPHSYK
eukprot:scaffold89237_cov18-Tisochrysis_lutea.AAC.1